MARQRSEARNQASNGKVERMHRTIMNMARSKIISSGLPLSFFGGDAVQYSAYVLTWSPTNANSGKASSMEILTNVAPTLSSTVVFGSPCSVYRDLKNNYFAKRVQRGLIIGIGDDTKGY